MQRPEVAALAAIGIAAALASSAIADPEVRLTIRPATGKAAGHEPPQIVATVIDGPAGQPAGEWRLIEDDLRTPVSIRASSVKSYAESDEPIAIVVVVEGHRVFMGGRDWDDDPVVDADGDRDASLGVLPDVIATVDTIAKFGPRGSQGAVVVYNQATHVAQPMGPLSGLSGAVLGVRKDYEALTVRDVVSGVRMGVAELEAVTTPRKALIVIGDGAGHEEGTKVEGGGPTASAAEMTELGIRCERGHIETIALNYDAGLGDELSVIGRLKPRMYTVRTTGGFAAAIDAALADLGRRQYVTFPGRDPATGLAYAWDGKLHRLDLVAAGAPVGEWQEVVLAPAWHVRTAKRFPWWIVGVACGGVLALLLVWAVARRPGLTFEPPAPLILPAAPAPLPVPMRTVMIGTDYGLPVVGWLVPLTGPSAYHTFKLKPGVTRIGSGGAVDIAITDPYVSTDHCEIASGPDGFRLKDAGAINGLIVNDRKVAAHDLVDNDVITLGRTHVVFKSTV